MATLEGDLKLIRELLEIEIPSQPSPPPRPVGGSVKSECARIVGGLNRLALYRAGRSFNDLCRG
jgi:hypothetical protein